MSGCDCQVEITNARQQRRLLILLLAINGLMFFIEIGTGILAQSTGLIADSLDMLADATVYAIALYAVGRSHVAKINAAFISGIFQILLALGVAGDVLRRFIYGSAPDSLLMMGIGVLALVANVLCLRLISGHRQGEVHMRASWIFSRNDVIANLGLILAGSLVALFNSRLPDLIIGAVITVIVLRGGWKIVQEARHERLQQSDNPA